MGVTIKDKFKLPIQPFKSLEVQSSYKRCIVACFILLHLLPGRVQKDLEANTLAYVVDGANANVQIDSCRNAFNILNVESDILEPSTFLHVDGP
jgi:hypothetical protein